MLAGLGLNGRIPSDLGRLDSLVSLSLRRNRLSGPIPPELGNLASLDHLNLSYNALTGGIPPELGSIPSELAGIERLSRAVAGHHGRPTGTHNLYLALLGEAGIVPCCCWCPPLS